MPRPIFISGSPRSGTSILGFLIGKHGNILSYLEPKGVYRYFLDIFIKYPVPFILFRYLFLKRVRQRIIYSVSSQAIPKEVDTTVYFSEINILDKMKIFSNCRTKKDYFDTYHKFADLLFGEFAKLCGKNRWCVKLPDYLFTNIDKINQIHPDMKFIHIVRDGRDVIASIVKQPWAKKQPNKLEFALNLWIQVLEKGYDNSKKISDDNLMTVKLEDIVEDAHGVLGKIVCPFIDEKYDKSMELYANEKLNAHEGHRGRWQNDLNKEQLDIILRKGGHLLERYGYL